MWIVFKISACGCFILFIALFRRSTAEEENGSNCRISRICSDYKRWNVIVSPIADQISDVCDVLVQIECQDKDNQDDDYIHLLLSTVSDEISATEEKTLSSNSTPPGIFILHHRRLSNDASAHSNYSFRGHLLDLKGIPLNLPSETCGQMFLVTLLWRHFSKTNNSIVSTKAWPFRVPCETGADLKLSVEFSQSNLINNNITLKIGELLVKQFPGFKMYLSNGNSSNVTFLRRSNPSVPQFTAFITPRKHSFLTRGEVEYDALNYRLGDVSLLGVGQLIRLDPDQSSPAIKPGQVNELNPSPLQLSSFAICGEALMVFRLDMIDINVENNFVVFPVFIDCWALPEFTEPLGVCGVIPDEESLGSSALMYTSLEPHISLLPNSYLYKTDEKTFKPVRISELMVSERIRKYQMVQLERDRLFKRNQCPTHFELRLRFNETLFGQLCALIENIDQGWILINSSSSARSQQESIRIIGQAVAGLLSASTAYNSVTAYFVDSVLNGLFSYWPFFPFEVSTQNETIKLITNSSELFWHDRIAKVFSHFMRTAIYTDYDGQLNPDAGLQIFLNQLIWSPESLYSDHLPHNVTTKLRLVLIMILEKQLPKTFDDLPSEIFTSLSEFIDEFRSPLPVKEESVRNSIENIHSIIRQSMKSSSHIELLDKLQVLQSIIGAFNNSFSVKQLTFMLQKIQESVALNKQWILMDGMSDTSLDSDLYCRLRALIRLNFRQDPKAENLLNRLDRITFWKKDSGVVYRGDLSSITGRLYWNRIAVCNCDGYSQTKYYSRRETL